MYACCVYNPYYFKEKCQVTKRLDTQWTRRRRRRRAELLRFQLLRQPTLQQLNRGGVGGDARERGGRPEVLIQRVYQEIYPCQYINWLVY